MGKSRALMIILAVVHLLSAAFIALLAVAPSPIDWGELPGLLVLLVALAIGAAVGLLVWGLLGKASG